MTGIIYVSLMILFSVTLLLSVLLRKATVELQQKSAETIKMRRLHHLQKKHIKQISQRAQKAANEIRVLYAQHVLQVEYTSQQAADMETLREELLRIKSEHQEELRELLAYAHTDFLTKVLQRAPMIEAIQNALTASKSFSLIMCDVDHFKSINDTYGHLTGDKVLKRVASVLEENTRHDDIAIKREADQVIVARFGGEEFLILLPETDGAEAAAVAERLRQAIEGNFCECPGQQVTASFGVTQCCLGEETEASILERVDNALYVAKHNGRNRVEVL